MGWGVYVERLLCNPWPILLLSLADSFLAVGCEQHLDQSVSLCLPSIDPHSRRVPCPVDRTCAYERTTHQCLCSTSRLRCLLSRLAHGN
ncbi:hypothetical protein BC939DRAFT_227038 [Gamsiella multidivaricata]|uniref:uncharacterized protein n=1 Tax=Gamsiella multidivaricata TaxID=101098 RepID=UPI002220EC90|nr:uncharacterized protein BC939DRAFT_227038 [Gamsiella multidivaricata]KAI7831333.1 hypothetical protein BC939DRAFT_227038 [Gamsiella multidivaricata]